MAYGFNSDKSKFDIDSAVTDLTAMIATKADAGHKHSASDITSGTLSVARGGTGQTTLQATRNAMGLGNTTGALPIANGGTGLTASPSMLANLGSTSAANVLQASPRPGITGTLPVSHGGTGATTVAAARNALGLGNTTGALPIANGGTGATTALNALKALGMTIITGSVTSVPAAGVKSGTVTLPTGSNVNDYVVVGVQQRGSTSEAWDYAYPRANINYPVPYVSIDANGKLNILVINMNGSSARTIYYRLVLLKVA